MTTSVTIIEGDCLKQLASIPDNSVDSIVTDPPYGLSNTDPKHVSETLTKWVTGDHEYTPPVKGGGFMGKTWDSFVPPPAVWNECMRVLKPGGHMLVFAGTRTQDLMGLSIRLAGFDIRDGIGWIYGSGFPKSMDVSKAIDKAVGAEGTYGAPKSAAHAAHIGKSDYSTDEKNAGWDRPWMHDADAIDRSARIYEGGSEDARRWSGWGTALKPAIEPIIVARKPIKGTVAGNVLAHGTGGINVDGCRVGEPGGFGGGRKGSSGFVDGYERDGFVESTKGRFPPNVLLDENAAAAMDRQSGNRKSSGVYDATANGEADGVAATSFPCRGTPNAMYADSGGASRFFPVFKYQAKAPKRERPVIEREDGTRIQHPTVKPLALMSWLITLITPPGGTVLDPFAGSGTTLEAARDAGFNSIGIEAHPPYINLIRERLGENG